MIALKKHCGVRTPVQTALGLLLLLAASTPVLAATEMQAVLERAREIRAQREAVLAQREKEFEQRRLQQRRMLDQAEQQLATLQDRVAAQRARFEQQAEEISALRKRLDDRAGELGDLRAISRDLATETNELVRHSIVSAQLPERLAPLDRLARNDKLPALADLEMLWLTALEEIVAASANATFDAPVALADGSVHGTQVMRVGAFSAFAGDRFLRYEPDQGRFAVPPRQPGGGLAELALAAQNSSAGTLVAMPLDPQRGGTLDQLADRPRLQDRIREGGLIGYTILALAGLGLFIAAHRAVALWRVGGKVRRQLDEHDPDIANPLGRIMTVYTDNRHVDPETLELKLDEAILKETPELRRGIGTLHVLASISPLLGLLGTVTGIIETFQAVTLYGAGDPRVMSSGISQSLVTTVLGLVAAIPLVLLHSALSARAEAIVQILDEQSASMVALLAEVTGLGANRAASDVTRVQTTPGTASGSRVEVEFDVAGGASA